MVTDSSAIHGGWMIWYRKSRAGAVWIQSDLWVKDLIERLTLCLIKWGDGFRYRRTAGSTPLNQPSIGACVLLPFFKAQFEAFWTPLKFNICFNVWVVFRLVFAVRAFKQRLPVVVVVVFFDPFSSLKTHFRQFYLPRTYFFKESKIYVSVAFKLMLRP